MASSSESLQTSVVLKELKRNLSEKYQVSKEAREAIQLSATIFIHYITSAAIELVQSQKKSTIQPQHILRALEENGFEEMIPEVEAYLQTLEEGTAENPPVSVPTDGWFVSYNNCDSISIEKKHEFSQIQ